ncbi:hypothetical protein NEUTE1DRAFT_121790 [Neurospora tetrasperma FGSC 2508]|uniref:Uncharacterized protein n=1 Tax=Neurospora tetrasperma (strain FGSC 2508 / ATCC MYA-4615 / P0657) TaxID=510951 RepID=F8MJZ7_NEUT8|nr:uncharacterized protein NEUTE1DRAFT_121790 [Neurospora tetrasperma FGSC 2508]EGO57334.1 hypothetical protein NEUTE1DRAFT_121790 [Neurospora tetrasperma FGSC 2508]
MLFTKVFLPLTALLATASATPPPLLSFPSSLPPSFDPYNDIDTTPIPTDIDLSTSFNTTTLLETRNPADYTGATADRNQGTYNGPYTYTTHYCGAPRTWATLSAIHDGESYLYGLKGQPRLGANKCSRNNHDITLRSWGSVAEAAAFLTGKCFKYMGGQTRIGGQVFFKERWNVFITVNKC